MPLSRSSASDVEQLVDDGRGQPQRRLVEQQDARAAPSARGRWPASAARRPTAGRRDWCAALAGAGSARAGAAISAATIGSFRAMGAEQDVVAHAELGKHLPALGHQHQAGGDDAVRRQLLDGLAGRGGSAARTGRSRPAERAHGRRLAGAVGAEHRHELARAAPRRRRRSAPARRRSRPRAASAASTAVPPARQRRAARPAPHLAAAEIGLAHRGVAPHRVGRAGGDRRGRHRARRRGRRCPSPAPCRARPG